MKLYKIRYEAYRIRCWWLLFSTLLMRSNTARANVIIFTCAGCYRSSLYEEDYAKLVGKTHIRSAFCFGKMRILPSWLESKAI